MSNSFQVTPFILKANNLFYRYAALTLNRFFIIIAIKYHISCLYV